MHMGKKCRINQFNLSLFKIAAENYIVKDMAKAQ